MFLAIGIAVFLLTAYVSIGVHEFCHLITAKKLGMSVPVYSIGFGPTLFHKKVGSTEYKFKLLPLGGFVNIVPSKKDEIKTDSTDKKVVEEVETSNMLLSGVHPLKRIAVMAAGPFSNLVLGVVVIGVALMTMAWPSVTNVVKDAPQCSSETKVCSAYESGIRPGDTIISIDGRDLDEGRNNLSSVLSESKNDKLNVVYDRNGDHHEAVVTLNEGKMGIVRSVDSERMTPSEAIDKIALLTTSTFESIVSIPVGFYETIHSIFTGERSDKSFTSALGMGKIYADGGDASDGLSFGERLAGQMNKYILLGTVLNLSLFTINMIPLMPLDGGRIFIALVDLVKMGLSKLRNKLYRPLGVRLIKAYAVVGMSLVITLTLSALILDMLVPVK